MSQFHRSAWTFNHIIVGLGLALATSLMVGCGGGGGGAASAGGNAVSSGGASALTLLAGHAGGSGNANGTGAAASFNYPNGIATDSAGNVYIADTGNNAIRITTPAGLVTTLAGTGTAWVSGSADGVGAAASFHSPTGVCIDSAGNVYVADNNNHTIRKITPARVVSTLAGTAGVSGSADGTGAAATFNYPTGVATDSAGNVYVTDGNNHTVRKITPAGRVTTLAGTPGVTGSANGAGAAARFNRPYGIAIDKTDNVYVVDSFNNTIRKVTPSGMVTTLAGTAGVSGSADGTGAAARFSSPYGIGTDSTGNFYVTDVGNSTIRKITPAGLVTTLAGTPGVTGSANGAGAAASFQAIGIAVDSAGYVYVADAGSNTIREITPTGVVTTFAGAARMVGNADGTGAAAGFDTPEGIAADSVGNLYVADMNNATVRKITSSGVVSTMAGSGVRGSADGIGAAASFSVPNGITTDSVGNVYLADTGNNIIRKITPIGDVSTLGGLVASFYFPYGVATDIPGNVYVADAGSNTIRKITPVGVVTTLAGSGAPGGANGTGSVASFNIPRGIAADSAGNFYVTDLGNNTIRKITPKGDVSTLAGTAGVCGSADGVGAAARFCNPNGVATDSVDNVYVADAGNNTIRRITPLGVVTTMVGQAGVVGFATGALPGALNNPQGVAIHGKTLYITMTNAVVQVSNLP
jgi:sugar lactone lactonase YvrE